MSEATTAGALFVGVDPAKRTLAAYAVDRAGGGVAGAHFPRTQLGNEALWAWAAAHGDVVRWGVEGASSWGRHIALFLVAQGAEVREVCPNRTGRSDRRGRGKSDRLDAERIARETLAHPDLPAAFKRGPDSEGGLDEGHDLLRVLHRARKSLLQDRQHLLNEAEALLNDLPDEVREPLGDGSAVRPRLGALAHRDRARDAQFKAPIRTRLEILDDYTERIIALDRRDRDYAKRLEGEVTAAGSTLTDLRGIAARSAAAILVETGDPRRFSPETFARFNGTAPIPAATGDGGKPTRWRLNRGGNRRLNAVIYTMAITQLRCHPPARTLYDNARARGHTKAEALRILKRHLSNTIYRHMINDLHPQPKPPATNPT